MTTSSNQMNIVENKIKNNESLVDSVKILSEMTRRDIEKSYNLDTTADHLGIKIMRINKNNYGDNYFFK